MKRFLALLLVMFAFSVPAFAKSYINGIDAHNTPFAYIDGQNGKPAGFDVESLDWIAKNMGFEVKHTPIAWEGILPALLAKKIDMICSGMSITPERARLVAFSDPYWKAYNVFVVKQDSDLTVATILTEKLKVGGQRGSSEAIALAKMQKEHQLRFEMRLYDSGFQMLDDVANGRIHAALIDSQPAQDAVAAGKSVKIAGVHGVSVNFGVAFRQEDETLRALVNEGYAKLKADPFWRQLRQKYGVKPFD
jgi:polar amino acid transport system substrate-binding protein